MSVLNPEATADAIGAWIKGRIGMAGAKAAVVGISGGADSALVAMLCVRAGVPTVGVIMPCHSSPAGMERAKELCLAIKIPHALIDLEPAYRVIHDNLSFSGELKLLDDTNLSRGALRSCLRSPALDYVGKLTNGLIIGTGNRDEDEMTRYFQKRGDGCVDISPIAKLHKSEVYEMLRFLGAPQSIIEAIPSADLWGADAGQEDEKELGFTYAEIEWGIRELLDKPTSKDLRKRLAKLIGRYTQREQEILNKLDSMEKSSRHKSEAPPVFNVREVVGLVQ